jgi:hypothetical protein
LEKTSWTDRVARVLPLKSLPDEQYEEMLNRKLQQINVEISMLDDQIAKLKQQESEQKQ